MLTPEMMEFAKAFGFPALLVMGGGWVLYKVLSMLASSHVQFMGKISDNVEASTTQMTALTETTKRVENKLDTHIDEQRRWQQGRTA